MNTLVFCCILFVASASSCYGFCQFPLHLWCSSPEIAKECRVSTQCHGLICLAQVDARPVDVEIYYESFCSDCNVVIEDYLKFALKEVGEIMNLQLVPYGDTQETPDGDSWKFTCVEGDNQCSANILQACAVHLVWNISLQFSYIECMITTYGEPEENAKMCALKLGGIDWADIISCSRGSQGRRLEHHMGLRTKSLVIPDDSYLPFVTVNGVFAGDITEKKGTEFVDLICQNYQGPFPYGCRRQTSHPNHSCRTA